MYDSIHDDTTPARVPGRARLRPGSGRAVGLVAALTLALPLAGGCMNGAHSAPDATGTAAPSISRSLLPPAQAFANVTQHPVKEACSGGRWRCLALVRTDDTGHIQPHAAGNCNGYGPQDLASAYGFDNTVDPNTTVAIVGAYNYANAASDLAQFRSDNGLPACDQSTGKGCVNVIDQNGDTCGANPSAGCPSAPPQGDDWTTELALDLDMVSSACPKCKLILVEATDDQGNGLFQAEDTAASMAPIVTNSWGGPETSQNPSTQLEQFFNHPGVSIFVATGDSGWDDGGQGPDYPGTSAFVTGVGGTTLVQDSSARGWSESAWACSAGGFGGGSGCGGSGCSLSVAAPSWETQTDCQLQGGGTGRASSDVSAVGDPATGVCVYNAGANGYIVVGGTSAATPLVAGIYAVSGLAGADPSFAYKHTSAYYDVTSGSNSSANNSCGGNSLCNAGTGWDGPTGIGTPNAKMLAAACSPQCSGKQCGSDGCGGTCGSCSGSDTCNSSGQCVGGATPDAGQSSSPDAGTGPALVDASPGNPGSPDASPGNPNNPGGGKGPVTGGCQAVPGQTGTTGGAAALLFGLLFLGATTRKRRRADRR